MKWLMGRYSEMWRRRLGIVSSPIVSSRTDHVLPLTGKLLHCPTASQARGTVTQVCIHLSAQDPSHRFTVAGTPSRFLQVTFVPGPRISPPAARWILPLISGRHPSGAAPFPTASPKRIFPADDSLIKGRIAAYKRGTARGRRQRSNVLSKAVQLTVATRVGRPEAAPFNKHEVARGHSERCHGGTRSLYVSVSLSIGVGRHLTMTDTFSALLVGGKSTGEWAAVRRSKNYLDNRPAMDVTSNDIRCYEFAPGTPAELTVNLTAGSTVAFKANPSIYHQGPLAFYMAKAPAEKTAATFDGSGDVWFKIWHEQPKFGEQLSWSSEGAYRPSRGCPFSHQASVPRHKDALGDDSQVHPGRRLPSAHRAHRPARRPERKGGAILRLLRPDHHQWRRHRNAGS